MICSYNIKNHIYDKLDYLYTPINKGSNKEKEIKNNYE